MYYETKLTVVGFVNYFFVTSPSLFAAWHKAAGQAHHWNYEKTVSKPVHFVAFITANLE